GLEATTAIREREKSTGLRVPIIAITAHVMKGDRERCLAAGMDGYLPKPIEAQALFAMLEDSGKEPARPAEDTRRESNPVIDEQALLQRVQGDRKLLRELVAIFRNDRPAMLAKIRAKIRQRDAEGLRLAAHAIKGSLASFAAARAAELALQLETMGRENRLDRAGELFHLFEKETDRVEEALRGIVERKPRKARSSSRRKRR
ncbi:MAG: Hpt domain-containing protein, partial [Acidobacteria bacterium]|nr:Hpt domain-containing protein [Acidobacteriota bacterium]